jgi:L-amino acid N-acyltransferase YncA
MERFVFTRMWCANETEHYLGRIKVKQNPITIRASRDDDVDAMVAIYHHHIARGVDSSLMHSSDEPQADDLNRRRRTMRKHRLPHLVADCGGVVIGYAYAVLFRKRPAYRYTLKHSIYVHPDHLHSGIGRILLPALIDACAAAGYRQMIGYIDAANLPSIQLHKSCGFNQVGYLPSVGYKFGHWTDVVLMQRSLGSGCASSPDVWLPPPSHENGKSD